MFKERGFYNVTVEEIAEAAGISVGSLYHHFKNKYALLTAWHDRLDEEYMKHYEEVLQDPELAHAEAPVIIKEMLLWIQDVCVNYGHEYISVVYAQMLSNIDFANIMADPERPYYKIFFGIDGARAGRGFYKKGHQRGTARPRPDTSQSRMHDGLGCGKIHSHDERVFKYSAELLSSRHKRVTADVLR